MASDAAMLAERAREKVIDGMRYRVQPIAFGTGIKALNRLIKILAPIVAAALREGRSVDKAAAVVELLPEHLTDESIEYFRTVFSTGAWYAEVEEDGDPKWIPLLKNKDQDAQHMHFAGRYMAFLEWLIFCVEVNFGGFFDGVASEASEGQTADPSQPKTEGGIFATLGVMLRGKRATPDPSIPTPGNGSVGGS